MAQLGGNVEACSVCAEKVYPTDRFVIEKLVMHKTCFKCKLCERKLSLTNFAAVNNTVYCKVHYLQLFKESGGKYDKAFGDGGFQKKSSGVYMPGQFTGVGKTNLPSHITSNAPDMSPVVASKVKPITVQKLSDDDDESSVAEEGYVTVESPAIGETKSSVKDILQKYEATLRDASSASESDDNFSPKKPYINSPSLTGNTESRMKWLTGVSSTHVKKHAEVDDKPLGSVAQRKAAYLASAGSVSADEPSDEAPSFSASFDTSDDTVHENMQNRLKWNENLGASHLKPHVEIDSTPGGTAEQRREAYLAAAASSASPASSTGSGSGKKVSRLVTEKMKIFNSPPSSASSSPAKPLEVSPGRIDEKLKMFVDAASSSLSPITSTVSAGSVGRIDEKIKNFEDAAKGHTQEDEYEYEGEEAMPPPRTDVGISASSIRSFNEGANAALRRTPSWLRQQRALEEAERTASEQASTPTLVQAEVPVGEEEGVAVTESTTEEYYPSAMETPEKPEPTADNVAGEENEPATPVDFEDVPAAPPTGSIMKRTGSFKKDKSVTPAEKRIVRFGAAEVHELPSSPKSPDVSDTVRAATSHSATKGSALAAYFKAVENGGGGSRKRNFEESTEELSNSPHVESPPPPILSPGSKSPSPPSSLMKAFAAGEDVLNLPDEVESSGDNQVVLDEYGENNGEVTGTGFAEEITEEGVIEEGAVAEESTGTEESVVADQTEGDGSNEEQWENSQE